MSQTDNNTDLVAVQLCWAQRWRNLPRDDVTAGRQARLYVDFSVNAIAVPLIEK